MPRAKRTIEDADANANAAAPAPKSAKGTKKRAGKEKENLLESDRAQAPSNEPEVVQFPSTHSAFHHLRYQSKQDQPTTTEDPFEYITFCRPYYDFERENNLKMEEGKDGVLGEDELWKYYIKKSKCGEDDCMCGKPLRENPDWTWFTTRKAWQMRDDLKCEADFRHPDYFDMYVYNDFAGYGIQQVIENTLVAFNTEYTKKNPSLNELWAIIEALDLDDGDRMFKTLDMIGCAALSMLNRLDLAGKLKPNSEFKDIALVISVFLLFAEKFEDNLLDFDIDEFWHQHLASYVKRNSIAMTGVAGIEKKVAELEETIDEDTPFIKGNPEPDQWNWKNNGLVDSLATSPNGRQKKRKEYNFDNKDPVIWCCGT
ncbi:hypothetical protein EV356DRAFT_533372 [Viridothelium virens]|uniref:Uncharacterized protein n=1 Tax=Viridothelium virens TaxID=1048519 RepID=A0A6A6H6W3_VIRVR|nr:hypothetical protein EV356DRAFT_533372 [Viridothelium virens]